MSSSISLAEKKKYEKEHPGRFYCQARGCSEGNWDGGTVRNRMMEGRAETRYRCDTHHQEALNAKKRWRRDDYKLHSDKILFRTTATKVLIPANHLIGLLNFEMTSSILQIRSRLPADLKSFPNVWHWIRHDAHPLASTTGNVSCYRMWGYQQPPYTESGAANIFGKQDPGNFNRLIWAIELAFLLVKKELNLRGSYRHHVGMIVNCHKEAVQRPHINFLHQPKQRRVWICHVPLCAEGSWLYLYTTKDDSTYELVHIPFGSFLVLRDDVWHGGFVGGIGNLRLHLNLYPMEVFNPAKGGDPITYGEKAGMPYMSDKRPCEVDKSEEINIMAGWKDMNVYLRNFSDTYQISQESLGNIKSK